MSRPFSHKLSSAMAQHCPTPRDCRGSPLADGWSPKFPALGVLVCQTRTLVSHITVTVVLVLLFCGAPSMGEPVETVIVGPDRVPTLLLPAEASEQVRTATADLQRCLEVMTGQRPRMVAEPEKAAAPILAVGAGELVKTHVRPDELKALGPEEVVLRTFADGVVLTGRTDLATQHAVYVFLERLGCRWFFPGDAWEEIPKRETIRLEALDVRVEPSFRARSIWYGWGTIRKCALDYRNWVRRNRMGGWLTGSVGHAYAGIADPDHDFEEHPEYFPLIDGKRVAGGQLCLSNPDIQQRAIERARKAFGKNPAQLMISMSPNDGGGYCDCDPCAAMGSRSDQTLKLCNVVAEAIADEFPDRYLGMYAYSVLPFPRRGRFARGEVKGRDTYPVQFELPERGLYRLQIDSVGTSSRLGFGTMPCSLVASVTSNARLGGGPERLHFFVPSGTATFAVGAISPAGQGKVMVRDAEGKMVAQETVGCPQGCEFAVRVPPGADGKVWSLSVDKCDDEVGLYLIAVPPYLRQRPEQLLIPQETAKKP